MNYYIMYIMLFLSGEKAIVMTLMSNFYDFEGRRRDRERRIKRDKTGTGMYLWNFELHGSTKIHQMVLYVIRRAVVKYAKLVTSKDDFGHLCSISAVVYSL